MWFENTTADLATGNSVSARLKSTHLYSKSSTSRASPRSKVPSLRFLSHINVDRSSRPQKTPGRGGSDNAHHGEDEDTFYSLASARSHPDLSNSPAARPVSMGQPGPSPCGSRARLHGAAGPVSMGQPGPSPWGSRARLHGAVAHGDGHCPMSVPGCRRSAASTNAPTRSELFREVGDLGVG